MENEKQISADIEEYNEEDQQIEETLTGEELDEVSGGLARAFRVAGHGELKERAGCEEPYLRRTIRIGFAKA